MCVQFARGIGAVRPGDGEFVGDTVAIGGSVTVVTVAVDVVHV